MENRKKKVLVMGVIGADVHAVGNKILYHAESFRHKRCLIHAGGL